MLLCLLSALADCTLKSVFLNYHDSDTAVLSVYTGSVVQEVHQQFGPWAQQTIRVYAGHYIIYLHFRIGIVEILCIVEMLCLLLLNN